jgi:hypothetical protein
MFNFLLEDSLAIWEIKRRHKTSAPLSISSGSNLCVTNR